MALDAAEDEVKLLCAEVERLRVADADLDEARAEIARLRVLVGDAHAYLGARNLGEPAELLRVRLRNALLGKVVSPGEGERSGA